MDDKLNILIDLRKILNLYEFAYKNIKNDLTVLVEKNLENGFCFYLFFTDYTSKYQQKIIKELLKDSLKPVTDSMCWYITPRALFYAKRYVLKEKRIKLIKKITLQPRINHLKRTIARLEKELNITS